MILDSKQHPLDPPPPTLLISNFQEYTYTDHVQLCAQIPMLVTEERSCV
jgi:hypothetical protein